MYIKVVFTDGSKKNPIEISQWAMITAGLLISYVSFPAYILELRCNLWSNLKKLPVGPN